MFWEMPDMSREILLRTLSVAALAAALAPAVVQAATVQTLNGGGATSPQADYAGTNDPNTGAPRSELSLYNTTSTKVTFGTYWGSGSGVGQQAFLQNDLTCDINKVTGANGGKCNNTPGGANAVHYGTSDSVLNATQVSTWATSTWGQSAAGNLIQLPALGTGPAIVVNDTNVTSNGQLNLSDSDLCGIFSGLITDYSQLTDTGTFKPAPGGIQVVYRIDSAGPTFLLTNHLAAVCNSGNTKAGITFAPTTTFATLFPGGVAAFIPNSFGVTLSAGTANYMAGLSNGPVPQAIGYVSPDWTSITPNSPEVLQNGLPSPLLVAGIFNGKLAYTPTTKNILAGLQHVKIGTNLTPPANKTDGANPLKWVPTVQVVTIGYPIVGYGTFLFAQCYNNATDLAGIKSFLTSHYTATAYKAFQSNNGLVPIPNAGSAKFLAAIQKNILKNANAWGTDLGDKAACTGLAGR
jgi:phosphate transport system substrate-binding protein